MGEITELNYPYPEDFDTEAEYLADIALTTGRFIYTAETLPAYYPSGPQQNISVSELDGWTLCWSNRYGDEDSSANLLDDIWAACDGAYLMLAGGPIAADDTSGTDGTEGLAATGGDSGWILGAALALIGAGALVAVRRQQA